jgi:hypothetical protein
MSHFGRIGRRLRWRDEDREITNIHIRFLRRIGVNRTPGLVPLSSFDAVRWGASVRVQLLSLLFDDNLNYSAFASMIWPRLEFYVARIDVVSSILVGAILKQTCLERSRWTGDDA